MAAEERAVRKFVYGHSVPNQDPVWVPDSSVHVCAECRSKFAFSRRKHHCRGCGRVVCFHCGRHKQKFRNTQKSGERICVSCHYHLISKISGVEPAYHFDFLDNAFRDMQRIRGVQSDFQAARDILLQQMRISENPLCTVQVQYGSETKTINLNQLDSTASSEWLRSICWFIVLPPSYGSKNRLSWTKRLFCITSNSDIIITSHLTEDVPIKAYLTPSSEDNPQQKLSISLMININQIKFYETVPIALGNGITCPALQIEYTDEKENKDTILQFIPFPTSKMSASSDLESVEINEFDENFSAFPSNFSHSSMYEEFEETNKTEMNEIKCPRWYSCLSTEHKELLQTLIETSDPENKTEIVDNIMEESGVEREECENLIEWWFQNKIENLPCISDDDDEENFEKNVYKKNDDNNDGHDKEEERGINFKNENKKRNPTTKIIIPPPVLDELSLTETLDYEIESSNDLLSTNSVTRGRSGGYVPVFIAKHSQNKEDEPRLEQHRRPPPSPSTTPPNLTPQVSSTLLLNEEHLNLNSKTHQSGERIFCDTDLDLLALASGFECDFLRDVLDAHRHQAVQKSLAQRRKCLEITLAMNTTVDWDITDHAEQLQKVWEYFLPDHPFEGRKSKLWGEIGFQGMDPTTDFRGMGAHALSCLVYLAENELEWCRYLMQKDMDENYYYPMAATWINIAYMIAKLLNVKDADALMEDEQSDLFNLFGNEPENSEPFNQLFTLLVQRWDAVWVATKSSYMDTPNVLKAFRTRLLYFLSKKPHSFTIFYHWISVDNYVEEYKTWLHDMH